MGILDRYIKFNLTYPTHVFKHEKGSITYRIIGQSEAVMVCLMQGLMFDNTAHFQLFLLLKKHAKVISIETVKPLYQAKDDVVLIHKLLQFLDISKYHMVGMNLGGYMALAYQAKYHSQLKTLTLIQPLIVVTKPSKEQNKAIMTIKEVIEGMSELRKTLHLDDAKMALLEQIKDIVELHDTSDDIDQMDYFEYLLSRYDQDKEITLLQTLIDHLNDEPLKRDDVDTLSSLTYLLYGNDDDPFFGHDMALVACDVLSKSRIEYINITRYDIILKPHLLAYKIIKFIEK